MLWIPAQELPVKRVPNGVQQGAGAWECVGREDREGNGDRERRLYKMMIGQHTVIVIMETLSQEVSVPAQEVSVSRASSVRTDNRGERQRRDQQVLFSVGAGSFLARS